MSINEKKNLLDNNTAESSMENSKIITAKSKSSRFLVEVILLFGGAVLFYFTSAFVLFLLPLIFREDSIENVWFVAIPTAIFAGSLIYGMRFWGSIKTLKVGIMGKTLLRATICAVLLVAFAAMLYYVRQ